MGGEGRPESYGMDNPHLTIHIHGARAGASFCNASSCKAGVGFLLPNLLASHGNPRRLHGQGQGPGWPTESLTIEIEAFLISRGRRRPPSTRRGGARSLELGTMHGASRLFSERDEDDDGRRAMSNEQ